MLELILSMVIWGTLGIFVLWSRVDALDIAFYRCLIGAIIIGLFVIKTKKSVKINKSLIIITIAGIFIVLNWILLFKSFQLASITVGNMSYYLQPIILVLMGALIYKEKITLKNLILIFLSFSGVLLTMDITKIHSGNIILGAFFAIIAAFLYSIVTILMKNIKNDFYLVIFIQLSVGVVLLFPFIHKINVTTQSISCLIILGFIHTILAYYLYYRAIKKVSFIYIAVFSYLDPIIAIFTDIIFFNRKLNFIQICGIAITFLTAYILIAKKTKS